MTLTVDLPPDVENALRERAAAAGEDLGTVVGQLLAESLADDVESRRPRKSVEEFARRMEAWIALHPVREHVADDSRESIY